MISIHNSLDTCPTRTVIEMEHDDLYGSVGPAFRDLTVVQDDAEHVSILYKFQP